MAPTIAQLVTNNANVTGIGINARADIANLDTDVRTGNQNTAPLHSDLAQLDADLKAKIDLPTSGLRDALRGSSNSTLTDVVNALEASKAPTANAAGVAARGTNYHPSQLTIQQAVAEFLATPAGSKLYDAWRVAPWAQSGDGGNVPVTKSERRVVGEDIMDGAAKRLQAAEPSLSYEQAYAKALDSDPVAQLAYTVGNHRKPSGTQG
jgi:hypothetical protein